MTPQQEALRDKLKKGSDIYKEAESLRAYIKENEKIQAGACDPIIQLQLQQQNDELKIKYAQLIDVRSKIDRCIGTIEDIDLKSILIMRYLGHVNTLQIAERMHYGRNTINRKHKDALNILMKTGADKLLDY